MLVAIVFMVQVKRDEAKLLDTQSKIKNIVLLYTDLRAQLHNDLAVEFKGDFKKWHAALFPDLTVRFEEPSIQFDTGMAVIKDSFKDILQSFFPRYVGILVSPKYHDAIKRSALKGIPQQSGRGWTRKTLTIKIWHFRRKGPAPF